LAGPGVSRLVLLIKETDMIVQDELRFEGLDCLQVKNENLIIWITKSVGPRILGLSLSDGENLLAVLPDSKLEISGLPPYSLRGGHRLWYGPEDPARTYIPDDRPVKISTDGPNIQVTQDIEPLTGIEKSWRITLDKVSPKLVINHKLTNRGERALKLAPWAITMLKPGGMGILPQQVKFSDQHGLLPNRHVVFWPYTEVKSPHLEIRDKAVFVRAAMAAGALKVGAPNPFGWLGYFREGILFVKRTVYQENAEYLDRGASSQIYCSPDVIELETFGPVINLEPEESVDHQECWEIYSGGIWPEEISAVYLPDQEIHKN